MPMTIKRWKKQKLVRWVAGEERQRSKVLAVFNCAFWEIVLPHFRPNRPTRSFLSADQPGADVIKLILGH